MNARRLMAFYQLAAAAQLIARKKREKLEIVSFSWFCAAPFTSARPLLGASAVR
jgi:hypothetical protein